MPQNWHCNQGDDDLAVVVVSWPETGTVDTPCLAHWVGLCCAVAAEVGWRPPLDDGAEQAAAEPDDTPPPTPGVKSRKRTPEPAQRARTRRKLADRPDSADTSAQVVPWPESAMGGEGS